LPPHRAPGAGRQRNNRCGRQRRGDFQQPVAIANSRGFNVFQFILQHNIRVTSEDRRLAGFMQGFHHAAHGANIFLDMLLLPQKIRN